MSDFEVHAIPASVIDTVRPGAEHLSAGGGEQLRCCLRRAEPGEDIMLFSYELPLPPGPYRERGPVFAHAAPCDGPADPGYPVAFRHLPQVLRAYDVEGRIHPATRMHDGRDPERELAEVLADPAVVQVHSRNPAYGCFLFAVTRA